MQLIWKKMSPFFLSMAIPLLLLWDQTEANISLGTCSLSCNEESDTSSVMNPSAAGPPGKRGPEGRRGLPGPPGDEGPVGQPGSDCDCSKNENILLEMERMRTELANLKSASFPEDCTSFKKVTLESGITIIFPFQRYFSGIKVYCNQDVDDGGWIVIQRRMDGSEDFYRGWNDYDTGFGDKEMEMWLGLETIHRLTKNGDYELRIDLEDFSGRTAFAKYSNFSLTGSDDNYRISVSGYSGSAGNGLGIHNGQQFSTKDRDNDFAGGSCATHHTGSWWYHACHRSNLNGVYNGSAQNARGVSWHPWKTTHESLKKAEMKIRRKL